MPNYSLPAKLLAEFVGTFFLIAAGVAVILNSGGDLLAVAFAHGLAIAIAVTAVGHVSGGHFNPAVTVALVAFRKISWTEAAMYTGAQLLGGFLGAVLIKVGFDIDTDALTATVPTLADGIGTGQGILLEAFATFLLMWVVAGVAVDLDGAFGKVAGMPIGFSIVVGILMIGPATGAALNPARWFGPALLTGQWDEALVWVVGPIVGALVALAAYLFVVQPRLANVAVEAPND